MATQNVRFVPIAATNDNDLGKIEDCSAAAEREQPLFPSRPSPAQADLVSIDSEVEKEFRKPV
jgi:hypothetical protein